MPIRDRERDARALFARCAEGDGAAWTRFDRLYRSLIASLARRLLAAAGPVREEDVDDAVAEVMARLVADKGAKLLAYDGRSRPSTWLGLVTLTTVGNLLRSRGRASVARAIDWDAVAAVDPPPDAGLQDADRRTLVARAVESLPARDRALLSLVYGAGVPQADVGRILSMTPGAVAQALLEARARLRRILPESP